MTARKPSRKVFLNPHVLFSRLKAFWPLLLWGLAVAAALHIYLNGGKFGGMAGTVITSQDNAAPLEAGRLTRIFVKVGDTVTPNMPLAQMDTSLLVAEKAVYEAEAKALQGELEAVTAEVEHMEKLVSQRLASEQDLLPLRLEQKTLPKRTVRSPCSTCASSSALCAPKPTALCRASTTRLATSSNPATRFSPPSSKSRLRSSGFSPNTTHGMFIPAWMPT
jgi:hypothetical protein